MIYINTNRELIAQSVNVPNRVPEEMEQGFRNSVAEMYVERAGEIAFTIAFDFECNTESSSSFRDWQGGRHTQFHEFGPLVAYSGESDGIAAHKIADELWRELDRLAQLECESLDDIDA